MGLWEGEGDAQGEGGRGVIVGVDDGQEFDGVWSEGLQGDWATRLARE